MRRLAIRKRHFRILLLVDVPNLDWLTSSSSLGLLTIIHLKEKCTLEKFSSLENRRSLLLSWEITPNVHILGYRIDQPRFRAVLLWLEHRPAASEMLG
jgi:hypothetical protein